MSNVDYFLLFKLVGVEKMSNHDYSLLSAGWSGLRLLSG